MKIIQIPKKDGSYRTIYSPMESEKHALRNFLPFLNYLVSVHCPHAHGFVRGRSPVTAALKHCNKQYTICWDIKDFFDTVTYEMVQDYIEPAIYKELTIDGYTRQGLPTSPLIANLAAASLDQSIVSYIDGLCVYTRYADDLTISYDDYEYTEYLLKDIPALCASKGFQINKRKTRFQKAKAGRRVICGVAVGEESKTYACRKTRRRLRAAEHQSQLPVRYREKAKKQAAGLREWVRQKTPVQQIIEERTNNRGFKIAEGLNIIERRDDRFNVRNQLVNFPIKDYLRAHKFLTNKKYFDKSFESKIAAGLVCTFGHRWIDWIKNANEYKEFHDIVFWLPVNILPKDGLGNRLFEWRKNIPDLLKRVKDLSGISKYWHLLSEKERVLSFNELLSICRGKVYSKAKNQKFASEAALHFVDEDDYYRWEKRWIKANELLEYVTIPHTDYYLDGYKISVLSKTDPRALFAGEHTGCCQHPDGDGYGCAWHSVESPDGAILAVEKEGNIIAQSWLWRSGDILVADNCEALKGYDDILPTLYENWAKNIVGKLEIKQVRLGTRGDIAIQKSWKKISPISSPSGCYTDAKKQVLLVTI